jgi:endo-1,4-beta-xylanase
VKTISADELASIPLGGNVTYRPGVKLVKVTTVPKVYAVAAHGVLRWVKTEEVAKALYGVDWNKKVDDIPDAFFVNYTVGADIGSTSDFSPSLETLTAKNINTDKKLSDLPPPPVISPAPSPSPTPTPTPTSASTLKVLAEKRGIRFGSMYQEDLRNADTRKDLYDRTFDIEMSALTVGSSWGDQWGIHPSRTKFDFSGMDDMVNWGLAHNMELYAALVWYSDFDGDGIPNWLKATPNADVETAMNEHIDTVVGRYRGKIKYWNAVNEAVNDGDSGTLRQGHKWFEAMGDDYIRKAFVRAHAADPSAVLYYNEYDIESNKAKFDGTKALLINLKKQNAPVHALGWQMHVKPGSFDPATLLARMNEIADLGFDNYITELDVELPIDASAADYEQQKQTYKTVVQTVLAARRFKSIMVWGLRDNDPWWLTKNHPLLFDENYNKKPAYFGVQEALK